jgi:hypothetical protein
MFRLTARSLFKSTLLFRPEALFRKEALFMPLVLATLCLSSASAGAATTEFGCAGPFGRDASHAGLVEAFGAANVSHEEVFAAGDTLPMTVVFPKDPERRLMVRWRDGDGRRGLGSVIIRSPGWSAGGATVGMSIAEVQGLNARPFKLADFLGSDNDGQVLDWQGGKLEAALPGGCRIAAVFGVNDADPDAAQGEPHPDGLISEDPALRKADPRLYELTVSFAK